MTLQVGVIGAELMGTTHVRTLRSAVAGVDGAHTDPYGLIQDPGVDAAAQSSATGAGAWDGYAAAAVCEAAWQAVESGRPVDVDLVTRPGLSAGTDRSTQGSHL
jgi:hypothetical protein